MTIDPESLRDLARRYTAAWGSQDAPSVAAFFAPNGSLKVNENEPAVGREAIAEVAQGFMSAFPDMEVLMDDLIVDGDRAVYRWTLAGTNTGPGGAGRGVRISGFRSNASQGRLRRRRGRRPSVHLNGRAKGR